MRYKQRIYAFLAGVHSSIESAYDCCSKGRKFESQLSHITFVNIDHELLSTVRGFKEGSCQLLAKVYALSTCTA